MKLKLNEPMWENYNSGTTISVERIVKSKTAAITFAVIISIGIFFLDLVSNTQSAIGVLYIMPITMLFGHNRKTIVMLAALSCALLIADPRIIYGQPGYDSLYTDKLLAIVAIGLITVGILRYRKLYVNASQSKDEQVKKLEAILHTASQNVQKPVNNIHGLTRIMKTETSAEEREWIIRNLKESAAELDQCSKDLTQFVKTKDVHGAVFYN